MKSDASKAVGFLMLLLAFAGCTDATSERTTALGNRHSVVMFSDGQQVGSWISTGAPRSVANKDVWQFVDEQTGRFVTVTGDVVIEKLPN